ncbi:MAG: DUF418 domain-containing protein [Litorilinea sp.]
METANPPAPTQASAPEKPPAGTISPTARTERIQVLDILRGFALLGILLVNMAIFINPVYYVLVARPPVGGVDAAVEWGIRFFAEGKFYSLFSFLFGLGFTIIMTRAQARGVRFVPLQMRRLLVLLVLGLIHAVLIWVGDILTYYALLGMLLLLFRNTSPKWLRRWAVIMLLLPLLFTVLGTASLELARMSPDGTEIMASIAEEQATYYADATAQAETVYAQGNFLEITRQRWADAIFMWTVSLFIAPSVFAMFLLGAWFGKREIFRDLPAHRPLFRRLLIWGGIVGVIGNALYAMLIMHGNRNLPDLNMLIATVGQTFGAPALMLFYLAAITLLSQHAVWGPRLAILAPVGRMALTNYLLQSIICTLIFYGYGLGLFGQVSPTAGLILTLVIYLAQIPWSHWWLRRYRFGPVEWLWRTLTYGKPQPMRVNP